jgi:hypothetical protein
MGVSSLVVASGAKTQKTQEFTSTGTWTAPTGVVAVECFLVGGGGGGGGTYGAGAQGGGGGGGEVMQKMITVVPGTTYTITIGGGGAGATATSGSNAAGANGVSSTFGALLTAVGGGGGASTSTGGGINEGSPGSTTASSGGGASAATNYTNSAGGSGGGAAGPAFNAVPVRYGGGTEQLNTFLAAEVGTSGNRGSAVTPGSTALNYAVQKRPGPGVGDYGCGATGGWAANTQLAQPESWRKAGRGRNAYSSGAGNATSAEANFGCGGGGSVSQSNASFTGGNGGSGYCSIVWWE